MATHNHLCCVVVVVAVRDISSRVNNPSTPQSSQSLLVKTECRLTAESKALFARDREQCRNIISLDAI